MCWNCNKWVFFQLCVLTAASSAYVDDLDQIFFCDPVVSESICNRMRANRLINESNTTGGLRKILTGCWWCVLPFPYTFQRWWSTYSYATSLLPSFLPSLLYHFLLSPQPNFFLDPVVLESICYRRRANRLTNKSKTTGWLRKIWTGLSLVPFLFAFFHLLDAIGLLFRMHHLLSVQKNSAIQSYQSQSAIKRRQNDWNSMAIRLDGWKNWTGSNWVQHHLGPKSLDPAECTENG